MKTANSQSGFSLVSILVIMGVVLTSILMISQAKFNQQGTQKALKIKQSYTDVNQALINNVVSFMHTKLKAGGGGCVSPSTLSGEKLDGNKVSHTFFNSPLSGFRTSGANSAPKDHQEAMNRCRAPVTPSGSANRYYFCTKLDRDTTAARDSIMNARIAFTEFSIELIDLQTQQPITCKQYSDKVNDPKDGSAGMTVTMVLYWENEMGAVSSDPNKNKSTFSQKALSYIANQNN